MHKYTPKCGKVYFQKGNCEIINFCGRTFLILQPWPPRIWVGNSFFQGFSRFFQSLSWFFSRCGCRSCSGVYKGRCTVRNIRWSWRRLDDDWNHAKNISCIFCQFWARWVEQDPEYQCNWGHPHTTNKRKQMQQLSNNVVYVATAQGLDKLLQSFPCANYWITQFDYIVLMNIPFIKGSARLQGSRTYLTINYVIAYHCDQILF